MAVKKKKKASKKQARKQKSKKPSKKVSKQKRKTKKKAVSKTPKEKVKVIGIVTHYFPHVQAAVVKLKRPLSVGDNIVIKGITTHFEQRIESMQIDHVPIQKAKRGDEIGLQVRDRVREHDLIVLPS